MAVLIDHNTIAKKQIEAKPKQKRCGASHRTQPPSQTSWGEDRQNNCEQGNENSNVAYQEFPLHVYILDRSCFRRRPPFENIAFRMNSDQNSTVLSVSPMAEQTRRILLRPPRVRSLATSLHKKEPNKAGPTTYRSTKTSLSNTFLHLHGSQFLSVPTIKL